MSNINLTALAKLSFTVGETAELCGVFPRRLGKLIDTGRIIPAFPGFIGRPHRLSPGQVLGIAVASGLADSPGGCSGSYMNRMVKLWGDMSEETLLHWLGMGDDWTAESYSVWRTGPAFPRPADGAPPMTSEDEAALARLKERVRRVADAIRSHIGIATTDRTSGQPVPARASGAGITTKARTSGAANGPA